MSLPVCTSCGWTWEEFRSRGFLGCPNCYDELATVIHSYLSVRTGKLTHPKLDNALSEKHLKRELLEKEIALLLRLEKFEEATRLTKILGDSDAHAG